MYDWEQTSPEFLRLVQGDDADLTRVAFEVARDAYPKLDVDRYILKLDVLAERVSSRCPEGARVRHILGQINRVLYAEERLRGNVDDYYDPRNSYLNDVLDRRLGIPISLSVIYMAVAERLSLGMSGVNLPGHFLIRTGWGNATLFVDPFHMGAIIDRAGCARRVKEVTGQDVELGEEQLAPCSTFLIVGRMLRNLKVIHLKKRDFEAALPVLRRLVGLTNGDLAERRDLGAACVQAQRSGEAIDHLEAYLNANPAAEDARAVGALLRDARHAVALMN